MLRRTLVAAACALALWQLGTARADISSIYDALGRLIAVVDPSGDTAVYHYDAVGNLLSISRQASPRGELNKSTHLHCGTTRYFFEPTTTWGRA